MSAYHWLYSTRDNPDGSKAYLAECPNAPTQKFLAGPSKSRASLDSEIAECEKRWSTPPNPNPNADVSLAERIEQKRVRDENESIRLLKQMTPERALHAYNTAHGFALQGDASPSRLPSWLPGVSNA